MNRRAIRAIVAKDLRVVSQSRAVMLPIVLVPLVILVLLPGLFVLLPTFDVGGTSLSEMEALLEQAPPGLRGALAGYGPEQQGLVFALVYMMAPLYLILPLMVATVIAADSFAGEKERKTLEALLYSPTTDRELFLAKALGSWVPAMGVSVGGLLVYSLTANLAGWPVMGRIFLPNAMWLILALWVAPAVAALGLGAGVLVSSRVRSFQEAYQLSGIVVLPVVALVMGQAAGVIYFSNGLVALLGAVVWAVAGVLLAYGARSFRRSEITCRI